jgi:uncharacterized paraquat-inducible protein A
VVVFTMLASEAFDPRWIWLDGGRAGGQEGADG